MIRLSRMTDYGILLLTCYARQAERTARSARDVAKEANLPLPTVSKILKVLAKHDLLETHRGAQGGFSLARPAEEITLAEVIDAMEGPIGLTSCSAHVGDCDIENSCIVKENWRRINQVVLEALNKITIAGMAHPLGGGGAAIHAITELESKS